MSNENQAICWCTASAANGRSRSTEQFSVLADDMGVRKIDIAAAVASAGPTRHRRHPLKRTASIIAGLDPLTVPLETFSRLVFSTVASLTVSVDVGLFPSVGSIS